LIRARPVAHQDAMLAAVEEVYGLTFDPDAITAVRPNGKTDRQILRELLAPRGVEGAALEAGFDEFERIACEHHARSTDATLSPEDSKRTAALLAALRDDGHLLALLTGNLEKIGRHKMKLGGLLAYFPEGQGAFGSDAEHRPDLVTIARERAASLNGGEPHPQDDTLIIGDTPLDVAAAIAGGVKSIGVAGFRYTREDLLEAGADVAIDELDEVPAALDQLQK
jgi:phosphoglycolate phosphatase-like HAD superfamily hydrolase